MHVERTFSVARPVETVFDYLGDFTHTDDWDPGTVETRRTSGDGGVGTVYANTSDFMGRRVELTYTTVTFDRPRKVQFRGTNDSATATDTMIFSPTADGGTQIHYRADFAFGLLVRLVAPLVVRPRLERLADQTVAEIKRALAALPA